MFTDFIREFLQVFFFGFLGLLYTQPSGISGKTYYGGVIGALRQLFAVDQYMEVVEKYKTLEGASQMTTGQWIGAWAIVILVMLALLAVLIVGIYFLVRFFKRLFGSRVLNQDLVDEIGNLKGQIVKLTKEKDRILGLKIGYQGYDVLEGNEGEDTSSQKKEGESRFYKLTEVDVTYAEEGSQRHTEFNKEVTLEQICDTFRNYAANNPQRPWRKLYYEPKIIRLFFASLATTRLIILQGISGTGKTSLPECIGHFIDNPTTIASVQPSWRDRTEIFGYFNEFTKRFNETEVLKAMYDATYNEDVYLTVLDEMNIARVEYYFAEMLSILEMPSRDQWIVDLVPSGWPSDPKHVEKGRFRLPENMWFVGTANNDDSTFAISDKVYDRGMPININSKAKPFDAPLTDMMPLSYKHLEELFKKAQEEHKVSDENLKKFEEMDDYVIEHFRLAFGNRIVKQLREFVPVYVACGGTEIDGLDYVLCNKILRKFESLNLAYIRDEVDDYIQYLSDHFGEENMTECKEYLERLKKLF